MDGFDPSLRPAMLRRRSSITEAIRFLERRRSSLGISSLFEHMVPEFSEDSMVDAKALTSRSSFNLILEDVSDGSCSSSPTGMVPCALSDVDMSEVNEGDQLSFMDDRSSMELFLGALSGSKTFDTSVEDCIKGPAAVPVVPEAFELVATRASTRNGHSAVEGDALRSSVTATAVLKPGMGAKLAARPAALGVSKASVKGGGASAEKAQAAKRPRRPLPDSPAVQAAMPRPTRRGRKDPEIQAAVRGMSPERARLEKNRQSAKECRSRKKEYVTNLEAKVVEFECKEAERVAEFNKMREQLLALQQRYAALAASKA